MFLSSRGADNHVINSLKDLLAAEGSCLISDENQFLTVDQWKTLNHQASKLTYKNVSYGSDKTPHSCSFKASKIKCSGNPEVYNKPIFDVLTSVQSRSFISALTGINHFSIEICECHLCEEGDSIPLAWSQENFKGYDYIIHFILEGDYSGGQLIMTQKDQTQKIYTPVTGDIFVSSCAFHHEVKPITEGKRGHILALIQPHITPPLL